MGMLRDITEEVSGTRKPETVSTILKPVVRDAKHDKKRTVVAPKVHKGERVSAEVITINGYKNMDKSKVKNGDLIIFTRGSNQKVIFTHCAFALVKNGEIYITHASSYCPKPGICDRDSGSFRLDNYMKRVNFSGFSILRPQNYANTRVARAEAE